MNDGGPAFPKQEINQQYANEPVHDGMSLRDYFAAKAMQSLMRRYETWEDVHDRDIAKWSYEQADAMIREREK